ncbi:YdcF family protein [Richelia sinica]
MKKRLFTGTLLRLTTLSLPLLMWWGYKEVRNQFLKPQAVLVLGGSTSRLEREKFTAKFARQHPHIPIWITGGSPPKSTKQVFSKAGVDPKRLHLDYEAVDTVTNFTTLVDDLRSRGIRRVYLITSDFHMRRACVIGEIVLGSRGIDFQPISVPSENAPEPIQKSIRDGARAIIWLATGYTGAEQLQNKH